MNHASAKSTGEEGQTLVCPNHHSPLFANETALFCPAGETFDILDGIPRFTNGSAYVDAFGAQWKRYRLTQLDSHTGTTITADRLRRCLGEDIWHGLTGKTVLECGCGAGRFTEVLLRRNCTVTSVDLSEAVEANQENFPQSESHKILQADITRLPLPPQQFELVVCLGVIQHTPNPEKTIARIYEHVAPGGWLVIDHYTYNLSEFTKLASLLRFIMRRLPPEKGILWTEGLTNVFLPLHKRVRKFRFLQMILSRVSPVLCYYQAIPQLGDKLQKEWAFLDTHDSLTCWYRRFRTSGQIARTLFQLGLTDIYCAAGGNGVEARGRRPSI